MVAEGNGGRQDSAFPGKIEQEATRESQAPEHYFKGIFLLLQHLHYRKEEGVGGDRENLKKKRKKEKNQGQKHSSEYL